mmetsp:Transcript_14910/g.14496  ORF Transcript_14910/g.14496 Transcript_14910/m.14496 type:complete len:85 (+) Transcript_14910:1092-1346(+)
MCFTKRLANFIMTAQVLKRFVNRVCSKFTLILSNIPGPVPTFQYQGKKIKKVMYFAVAQASLATTVSFFSINGIVKMGMLSDKA